MNILFFGSSEYSVIILKALLKADYNLSVITTPDQPKPRSKKLLPNPVKQFCQKNNLSFQYADQHMQILSTDLIISADYGQKIPDKILKSAKIGTLNLHPSLLPKYRGATPVPRAILANEAKTGITIIEMTDKIDAGPIIIQKTINIKSDDASETLLKHCFTLGAKLLIKILPDYIEHKITSKPQPIKSPTPYCQRFNKKDGLINWKNFTSALKTNGQNLHNQIRALYPWPGIYTTMPNNKTLKILSAELINHQLVPTLVQLEGKNPISWKQFLAGYQHLLQ